MVMNRITVRGKPLTGRLQFYHGFKQCFFLLLGPVEFFQTIVFWFGDFFLIFRRRFWTLLGRCPLTIAFARHAFYCRWKRRTYEIRKTVTWQTRWCNTLRCSPKNKTRGRRLTSCECSKPERGPRDGEKTWDVTRPCERWSQHRNASP